jgi:hypothetical protein
VDPSNVVGLGASYGGFSVNYLNGNAPEGMFQALVNHDGVFDLRSAYYSTEELFFMEKEFGGTPCVLSHLLLLLLFLFFIFYFLFFYCSCFCLPGCCSASSSVGYCWGYTCLV